MLIKFKESDPRAGTTVRMDSSRGQHFINIGAADQVKEGKGDAVGSTTPPAETKPSEGLTVDELKAALTAKGVSIPSGAKKQDLADLLDGAK